MSQTMVTRKQLNEFLENFIHEQLDLECAFLAAHTKTNA